MLVDALAALERVAAELEERRQVVLILLCYLLLDSLAAHNCDTAQTRCLRVIQRLEKTTTVSIVCRQWLAMVVGEEGHCTRGAMVIMHWLTRAAASVHGLSSLFRGENHVLNLLFLLSLINIHECQPQRRQQQNNGNLFANSNNRSK